MKIRYDVRYSGAALYRHEFSIDWSTWLIFSCPSPCFDRKYYYSQPVHLGVVCTATVAGWFPTKRRSDVDLVWQQVACESSTRLPCRLFPPHQLDRNVPNRFDRVGVVRQVYLLQQLHQPASAQVAGEFCCRWAATAGIFNHWYIFRSSL